MKSLHTSSDDPARRAIQVRNFVLGALGGVVLLGAGLWLVRLGDSRDALSLPAAEPMSAPFGSAVVGDTLAGAGRQRQTAAPVAFVEMSAERNRAADVEPAAAAAVPGRTAPEIATPAPSQSPPATATAQAPPGTLDAGADAPVDSSAPEPEAPALGGINLEELPKAVVDRGFTHCGSITCNVGTKCCCESCIAHDAECEPSWCNFGTLSVSVPCGLNTCAAGEVCCNPSCGTCTRAGESCSTAVCD